MLSLCHNAWQRQTFILLMTLPHYVMAMIKIITISTLCFEVFCTILLDLNCYKTQVVLIRSKTQCDNIIRVNKFPEWKNNNII